MSPNLQLPADLVTVTEEILHGKLHFFVQCTVVRPCLPFFSLECKETKPFETTAPKHAVSKSELCR